MKNLLPNWLYTAIVSEFNEKFINEIRIRLNKPIVVEYKSQCHEVKITTGFVKQNVIAGKDLISYIVSIATKQSLYAFDDQIKKGYIATDSGIRIGICGEVSYTDGKVQIIKNISSLNIRIAHEIDGCSSEIIPFISSNGVIKNSLIISPPGAGKTTMLRDIVKQLSRKNSNLNILVCDERMEIAGYNLKFDLGSKVDVMSGANKEFVFLEGIKVMNPNVIVCDEISAEKDTESIKIAAKSGVSVIATAHARNVEDLKSKPYFVQLIQNKYFERIVVLSSRFGVGTIEGVFDNNFFALYMPSLI